MTKKLLLTAVAAGVMAFAGAAAAGNLTTGSVIHGDQLVDGTGKVTPYVIAKDFALTAPLTTNNTVALPSAVALTFKNTSNPNVVTANTDYVVTLTLSGPAKFVNQSQSIVTFGQGGATSSTGATAILSADGKTLTIYAKTSATVAGTLETVSVSGFNLEVSAQESVSVSYKLQQVIGAQTLDLDTSTAAEIVSFKNALTLFRGDTTSVLAALPNFYTFSGVNGALTSQTFANVANAAYNTDLRGNNVPTVDNIVTGYSAVVTGPQIQDILTSFDGVALAQASNVSAGSATFTANTGANAAAVNLVLTPKAQTAIQEGSYRAVLTPTYAAGWSGPASVTRNLVNVGLAGTNFYAPWFGFGGSAASSTLRIGNNSAEATGNIVVQLRARNGSVATATSATFPGVAGNSFRSITGAELRQAFGTDAANGDLLISIQSDAYNSVSAKVRTIHPSGQIFENSLDLLSAPEATAAAVSALQTTVNAIKAKTDLIP